MGNLIMNKSENEMNFNLEKIQEDGDSNCFTPSDDNSDFEENKKNSENALEKTGMFPKMLFSASRSEVSSVDNIAVIEKANMEVKKLQE